MNVTLDGLMSGAEGELDWHFDTWTNEMTEDACRQLSNVDTIILGRNTYNALAAYWHLKVNDLSLSRDDIPFAEMLNRYTKIVFSKTLSAAPWHNSILIKGDAKKVLLELKQQPGKDMIIFGSGKLVSSIISSGLIDEYVLWVHPVVLKRGRPLFKGVHHRMRLKLSAFTTFSTGVILLRYHPENAINTSAA